MTNLSLLSTAEVVDLAADLKNQIKALEKQFAAAEQVIRERATEKELPGNIWKACFSEASVRWTIDADQVKKEMGEAWWLEHCKISTPKPSLTFKVIQ